VTNHEQERTKCSINNYQSGNMEILIITMSKIRPTYSKMI